jgi:putative ABC transport system permease protein
MGASIPGIVNLLSRDFLKLVVISFIVACPVTWWLMHRWLLDFAYRIKISFWDFAAAGLLAVLITLLTVGFKAVNAAVANPVKSLRAD